MDATLKPDPLRALSTREVIGLGYRIYLEHFANLVIIAIVPHMAMLAIELLIGTAGFPQAEMLAVSLAIAAVFNAFVLAAMTFAIGRAVTGEMPGAVEAYKGGFGRGLFAIVAAYLVIWLLVTLGFVLLIVPGLIIGGLLLPTVPVIVLERRPPVQALLRAYRMMRPVAFKATAIFSFVVLISGVLPLLFHLIVGPGPFSPLLGAIVGAVTLPLAYCANVVLYFSARAGEGYNRERLEAELRD